MPPFLIFYYLRLNSIEDTQNERRILHWSIVLDCHNSFETNFYQINECNEMKKQYILKGSTKKYHVYKSTCWL